MNGNGKLAANEDMVEISEHQTADKQFVEIGMWVDQDVLSIKSICDGDVIN